MACHETGRPADSKAPSHVSVTREGERRGALRGLPSPRCFELVSKGLQRVESFAWGAEAVCSRPRPCYFMQLGKDSTPMLSSLRNMSKERSQKINLLADCAALTIAAFSASFGEGQLHWMVGPGLALTSVLLWTAQSRILRHYDVWNGRNVGSDVALTLLTLAVTITVLALLRPVVPRYAAGSNLSRFAWIAASLILWIRLTTSWLRTPRGHRPSRPHRRHRAARAAHGPRDARSQRRASRRRLSALRGGAGARPLAGADPRQRGRDRGHAQGARRRRGLHRRPARRPPCRDAAGHHGVRALRRSRSRFPRPASGFLARSRSTRARPPTATSTTSASGTSRCSAR